MLRLLLFFSVSSMFCQIRTVDSLEINKFWKSVNKISSINNNGTLNKSAVSQSEIETAMSIYYNVVAKSNIEFKKFIRTKYIEWKEKNKDVPKSKWDDKPGVKIRKFKEFLSLKYGSEFVEIIGVPGFIKGEIIGIEQGIYHSKSDNLDFQKIILKIKIEDVVKEKHLFHSGETIEISVLALWYSGVSNFYEVGQKYFFPIKLWNCNSFGCSEYSVSHLSNTNHTIFPINGNIIKDVEYFNIGSNISWEEFLSRFKELYIIKEGI